MTEKEYIKELLELTQEREVELLKRIELPIRRSLESFIHNTIRLNVKLQVRCQERLVELGE